MKTGIVGAPALGAKQAEFARMQGLLLDHYGVKAESRFLALREPAMRAHALDAGRGEPLVLIHGGDGEGATWTPLIAELQHEYRVLAVDRPGFGLSDPFDYRRTDLRRHAADFVVSLLDALELPSATIVACSMGGFFALSAALAAPNRVDRLVLVGMPVGLSREVSWPLRLICAIPGMTRRFMKGVQSLEGQRNQYRTMFHIDPDSVPELYLRTRLAGVTLPGSADTWALLLRRVCGLWGIRREMYLGDELPDLRPPTLVLWGERDMAPVEAGRAGCAPIPRGRFVEMKGVGHFPYLESPRVTADLIREFLRGDEAPGIPAVETAGAAPLSGG